MLIVSKCPFVGKAATVDRIMKRLPGWDLPAAPPLLKIAAFLAVSLAFFYLGCRWSDSNGSPGQLLFFSRQSPTPAVARSPNTDSSSINLPSVTTNSSYGADDSDATVLPTERSLDPPPPPPSPPPPPPLVRFGIVDENGTMREDFEVGDFDPDLAESVDEVGETGTVLGVDSGGGGVVVRGKWKKFRVCPESMREYIPCLDNVEAIRALNSKEKGEEFERHCPDKALDCVVPAPRDYKKPIPWPKSRDEVISCWFPVVANLIFYFFF